MRAEAEKISVGRDKVTGKDYSLTRLASAGSEGDGKNAV